MTDAFDLEHPGHYDLVTPDGRITSLKRLSITTAEGCVRIENISPAFVGFQIEPRHVFFNIKSSLAQLGLDGAGIAYDLDSKHHCAEVQVLFTAMGNIAKEMLNHLPLGASVGKLFAADERRRVRNTDYFSRLFGRSDRWGKPLLSLGAMLGTSELTFERVEGRVVAYISLQNGQYVYNNSIYGFLPTLARALVAGMQVRDLVRLHQEWRSDLPPISTSNEILLARTLPLHIRTVFARVVSDLLPEGYKHTTACILEPTTQASGDIYELYGNSTREIIDVPLEFYTLEPYREHVSFADRDQLQSCLENSSILFDAFATAPQPIKRKASVYVVKGDQLLSLTEKSWISRETRLQELPRVGQETRQGIMVERYIKHQPCYPFLKAIDDGQITSQGILLCRYFPSPFMKRMLLSDQVQRCLKGVYFLWPSESFGSFFSAEDRAMLHDLHRFAIPVYWVDTISKDILQYTEQPNRDTGMFVPISKVSMFLKATMFGIYGSNLFGGFEDELRVLLKGILAMRSEMNHPFLHANTPLALVTGGGPGAMEIGNRLARELDILSCANIVDFRKKENSVVNEQTQNPYVEAKMTYRLDKLVERQAEFNLDYPIFLPGGIGTDFEFTLEEVRRKVGAVGASPIILFGSVEHWHNKITERFQCNRKIGTIVGSEWISNCFYCVQTGLQGIWVYRQFFAGKLPIGKNGPIYEDGFVTISESI